MSNVRIVSGGSMRAGGRLWLAVLLLAVGLFACQSDQEKVADFMERGESYAKEEQFKEAVIEFRNALQIDPNLAAAHRGLAEAYLRLGEVRDAYWELSETIRIDPSDTQARSTYAAISLGNGRFEEVLVQADALLEMDPSNVVAMVLRAQALERLGRIDEVPPVLTAIVALEPDKPEYKLLVAGFHHRRGNVAESEKATRESLAIGETYAGYSQLARLTIIDPTRDEETESLFRKAIEVAAAERAAWLAEPEEDRNAAQIDSRSAAHKAAAGFYIVRERTPDAIAILTKGAEALGDAPKDKLEMLYMLSGIYRSQGDESTANEIIAQAALADPENPEPLLVKSVFFGKQGDYDAALAAAREAVGVDPEDLKSRLRLAEALADARIHGGGEELVEEGTGILEGILIERPGQPEGLFVQAKFALAESDPSLAIESLTTALEVKPDWPQARFVLGSALMDIGEISRARVEMARALELDPALAEARRALVRIHAALGEHEYAVDQAERYIAERPNDPRPRILYAQSLVHLGRIDEAEEAILKIPADLQDANSQYALARIYGVREEYGKAREQILLVEQKTPTNPRVIETLLSLDRVQNRLPDSQKRIAAAVEAEPDNATLWELQGVVAKLGGDPAKSEASFKKAIELDPKALDAYEHLAELFRTQGRLDDTIAIYEQAVSEEPDAASAHHFLAVLYESTGRRTKAREQYQEAIRSDSSMAESKNNLAYLLASTGEDMDTALSLAQEAKAQMPGNPNTADTLGWVLLKRGVPTAAVGYFREALASMGPDDAARGEVGYHLGLGYEASGEPKKAAEAFNQSLEALEQQLDRAKNAGYKATEPAWASQARAGLKRVSG